MGDPEKKCGETMKIRTKIVVMLLITELLLSSIFFYMIVSTEQEKIDMIGNEHMTDIQHVFDSMVENDVERLSLALDLFMEDQSFKETFLSGDRDALYQQGQPLFTQFNQLIGIQILNIV